jgi:hypothetical protein
MVLGNSVRVEAFIFNFRASFQLGDKPNACNDVQEQVDALTKVGYRWCGALFISKGSC